MTKAQPSRTSDVVRESGHASAIRRWLQRFVRHQILSFCKRLAALPCEHDGRGGQPLRQNTPDAVSDSRHAASAKHAYPTSLESPLQSQGENNPWRIEDTSGCA